MRWTMAQAPPRLIAPPSPVKSGMLREIPIRLSPSPHGDAMVTGSSHLSHSDTSESAYTIVVVTTPRGQLHDGRSVPARDISGETDAMHHETARRNRRTPSRTTCAEECFGKFLYAGGRVRRHFGEHLYERWRNRTRRASSRTEPPQASDYCWAHAGFHTTSHGCPSGS